jgi:hypothetical protein
MDASNKVDPTKDTVTPDGVHTRYTVFITVAYLVVMSVAFFGGHMDRSTMDPNEWGDLLAGVFAPLAWLWLAVGYYLQRLELKEQRLQLTATSKAAQAQAEEQRNQAIAMKNLVEVTELQSKVAQRQLEIQEKHLRIGTHPRLSLVGICASDQHIELELRNAGALAFNVRVTADGPWAVELHGTSPGRPTIDAESEMRFTLRHTSAGPWNLTLLRVRYSHTDLVDVIDSFSVDNHMTCRFEKAEFVGVPVV